MFTVYFFNFDLSNCCKKIHMKYLLEQEKKNKKMYFL